jgi:hypothetical protein
VPYTSGHSHTRTISPSTTSLSIPVPPSRVRDRSNSAGPSTGMWISNSKPGRMTLPHSRVVVHVVVVGAHRRHLDRGLAGELVGPAIEVRLQQFVLGDTVDDALDLSLRGLERSRAVVTGAEQLAVHRHDDRSGG